MIQPIDIFEAAAKYRAAHNEAMATGAFTRNYDHPHYRGVRTACKEAEHHFSWGIMQVKTAAIQPEYAKRMGWL